jgi:hypothetical protein
MRTSTIETDNLGANLAPLQVPNTETRVHIQMRGLLQFEEVLMRGKEVSIIKILPSTVVIDNSR